MMQNLKIRLPGISVFGNLASLTKKFVPFHYFTVTDVFDNYYDRLDHMMVNKVHRTRYSTSRMFECWIIKLQGKVKVVV